MRAYGELQPSRGRTLDTDASPATRLSQRPATRSKGTTFEDLGSDFSKPSSSQSRVSSSRTLPGKPISTSRQPSVVDLSDDSSDDELDLINSSSPESLSSTGRADRSTTKMPRQPFYIDRHQVDSTYKVFDLTKAKIPKKSSSSAAHTQQTRVKLSDAAQPSSSPVDPSSSQISGRGTIPDKHQKVNQKRKLFLREHSFNQYSSRSRRPSTPPKETGEKNEIRRGKEDVDKTPRPSRPQPRPTKGPMSGFGKSQTVPDFSSQARETEKSQRLHRSQSISEEYPFSTLLPSKGNDSDSDDRAKTATGKVSGKGNAKARAGSSLPSQSLLPNRGDEKRSKRGMKPPTDPIGNLSPLRSSQQQPQRGLAAFPILSPLSSPASRQASTPPPAKLKQLGSQRKGECVIMSSDDEDAPPRPLRPFPMETQVSANIHSVSPVGKRTTPDSSDEGRSGEKRRWEFEKFTLDVDSDSDDDMFLDPSVDPATLCPWCDEPLPLEPTPHLRDLISAAKRLSRPDERPSNPAGLRAPLAAFVGVCQQHRFERNWIPLARRKSWPTAIEWDKLAGRISSLKSTLKAILDDVDEDFAPHLATSSSYGKARARKENEFWAEIVKNVREQGSAKITGVRGQFMHFNKSQPGYYGELGYMIIHQALNNLFPLASFHPDATLPLAPADFISSVLVPEAAVGLIIRDLALPRDKAIETLRESVEYGVAMFPVDEGEGDIPSESGRGRMRCKGAGEQMFMERARVRRKELEEEERLEKEEARKTMATKPKPRPRPRGKASGAQTDVESVGPASPHSVASGASGTKRRIRGRSRSSSRAPNSAKVVIELCSDSADSAAAAPSPSKRRRKVKTTDARSDADTDLAEPSLTEATPKSKDRPRPHAEARTASVSNSSIVQDDRDAQEAEEPSLPSSSQSMPFVSFNRKGDLTINVNGPVGVTPKAKGKPQRLATFSSSSMPDGGVKPLQIARERRLREQMQAMPKSRPNMSDGWLPNLRTGNMVESTDDEESDVDDTTPSSSKSGKKGSRFADHGSDRSWSWLLSDSSQTHPRN